MTLKDKLYNIMCELDSIESANVVMQRCIDTKLENSYEQYRSTVKNIYDYVLSRSALKVIKALTRINKSKEKKNGN